MAYITFEISNLRYYLQKLSVLKHTDTDHHICVD